MFTGESYRSKKRIAKFYSVNIGPSLYFLPFLLQFLGDLFRNVAPPGGGVRVGRRGVESKVYSIQADEGTHRETHGPKCVYDRIPTLKERQTT